MDGFDLLSRLKVTQTRNRKVATVLEYAVACAVVPRVAASSAKRLTFVTLTSELNPLDYAYSGAESTLFYPTCSIILHAAISALI